MLQLSAEGFDLHVVHAWIQQQKAPSACQLLLGFPAHAGGEEERRRIVKGLQQLHFHLNSCIREAGGVYERCTFFSTLHCNEMHLTWPIM